MIIIGNLGIFSLISLSNIGLVLLMVFNATFNNISVISWQSILLVEETRGPRENHQLVTSHWQTLSPWSRFELTTWVVIGTDCTGSCKFNYHTIMATMPPTPQPHPPPLSNIVFINKLTLILQIIDQCDDNVSFEHLDIH